jgi:hypothetical protein
MAIVEVQRFRGSEVVININLRLLVLVFLLAKFHLRKHQRANAQIRPFKSDIYD